jgi:hypothetical protein
MLGTVATEAESVAGGAAAESVGGAAAESVGGASSELSIARADNKELARWPTAI